MTRYKQTLTQETAAALNLDRARDAAIALTEFVKVKEPTAGSLADIKAQSIEEYLIDLLADLRHWCRTEEVDFGRSDELAAAHFNAELDEELEGGAA